MFTSVMMSFAKSRAKSGVRKQESPLSATPASYMFWLPRSYIKQPFLNAVEQKVKWNATFLPNQLYENAWLTANLHNALATASQNDLIIEVYVTGVADASVHVNRPICCPRTRCLRQIKWRYR